MSLTHTLGKGLDAFDQLTFKIENGVRVIVVVVTVFVMFLISCDALARYLFNAPLFFTLDLVSHFLLPMIMLISAGSLLRRARHISVDFFAGLLPFRLYQFLIGVCFVAMLPVFWVMTIKVVEKSYESFVNDIVAIGIVPWPFWVEQAIYAVCLGILAMRVLHIALTNLVAALSGNAEMGVSLLPNHDHAEEEFE